MTEKDKDEQAAAVCDGEMSRLARAAEMLARLGRRDCAEAFVAAREKVRAARDTLRRPGERRVVR